VDCDDGPFYEESVRLDIESTATFPKSPVKNPIIDGGEGYPRRKLGGADSGQGSPGAAL